MSIIKIMFVCHGNICRSPMAESIFKDLINKKGVSKKYYISSSATSTEEIWNGVGSPVYPPARNELLKHGLSCEGKRAVQLKKSDYDDYDYLVAMDENNLRNIFRIVGFDSDKKVSKLMNYTSRGGDVADPWYSGDFEKCYRDIYDGCISLLERLEGDL